MRIPFVGCILVAACGVNAQSVYKCTKADGTPLYTTEKCKDGKAVISDPATDEFRKNQARILREQKEAREPNPIVELAKHDPPIYPEIGMRESVGHSVNFAWGKPSHINVTTTASGDRTQWVFSDVRGIPTRYLYFVNGVLTTIQDSE